VKDPENTSQNNLTDVIVKDFSKHPVVVALRDSNVGVQLITPRVVRKVESPQIAENLKVEEVAHSGEHAILRTDNATEKPQVYPLMVAVEKNPARGATERGPTRIFVVGDSWCLDNTQIESGANRAFANNIFSWMLDHSTVLEGVGPRSAIEYRWLLSTSQQRMLLWVLLGALPGGILLFGGLVWIRRRK
jgi:hypothetical protein